MVNEKIALAEIHCFRPYHPQSQGKIKRSDRELQKKIHYDMINLGKKEVNGVQNHRSYMRVLNELAMKEPSWESPFEVYYGRIPNSIQNAGRYIPKQVPIDERIIELPSVKENKIKK